MKSRYFVMSGLALARLCNSGPIHAEIVQIPPVFAHEALQKPADQMSCRHLLIRTGQTARDLETFALELPKVSLAAARGELKDYFSQRNGYPADLLLNESVDRIHYPVRDAAIADTIRRAQTSAIWGLGIFEQQDPNGRFRKLHFTVVNDTTGLEWLELDVRAADVCLAHRFELVFFSGCPTETLRFETCDPNEENCRESTPWQSPPFVTQWWKCEKSTTLSFDLSELAGELGRRPI